MSEESPEITYEKWYPDVPPVMDSQELADLLSASDQVIRTWAREGVIPSHRAPGARKFKFLRHEIFEWLVENRYRPEEDDQSSTQVSVVTERGRSNAHHTQQNGFPKRPRGL